MQSIDKLATFWLVALLATINLCFAFNETNENQPNKQSATNDDKLNTSLVLNQSEKDKLMYLHNLIDKEFDLFCQEMDVNQKKERLQHIDAISKQLKDFMESINEAGKISLINTNLLKLVTTLANLRLNYENSINTKDTQQTIKVDNEDESGNDDNAKLSSNPKKQGLSYWKESLRKQFAKNKLKISQDIILMLAIIWGSMRMLTFYDNLQFVQNIINDISSPFSKMSTTTEMSLAIPPPTTKNKLLNPIESSVDDPVDYIPQLLALLAVLIVLVLVMSWYCYKSRNNKSKRLGLTGSATAGSNWNISSVAGAASAADLKSMQESSRQQATSPKNKKKKMSPGGSSRKNVNKNRGSKKQSKQSPSHPKRKTTTMSSVESDSNIESQIEISTSQNNNKTGIANHLTRLKVGGWQPGNHNNSTNSRSSSGGSSSQSTSNKLHCKLPLIVTPTIVPAANPLFSPAPAAIPVPPDYHKKQHERTKNSAELQKSLMLSDEAALKDNTTSASITSKSSLIIPST